MLSNEATLKAGKNLIEALLVIAVLFISAPVMTSQVIWTRSAPVAIVPNSNNGKSTIFITSVTPILPLVNQTIVIRGGGFGSSPKMANIDNSSFDTVGDQFSPSFAIRDHGQGTHNWEAGREANWWSPADRIGLKFVSWSDSQIVLSGFGSHLKGNDLEGIGFSPPSISPGDPIEIIVFGPGKSGSVSFNTVVNNLPIMQSVMLSAKKFSKDALGLICFVGMLCVLFFPILDTIVGCIGIIFFGWRPKVSNGSGRYDSQGRSPGDPHYGHSHPIYQDSDEH